MNSMHGRGVRGGREPALAEQLFEKSKKVVVAAPKHDETMTKSLFRGSGV